MKNFITANILRAHALSAASGALLPTAAATGGAYVTVPVDMQGADEITFFARPSATGAARGTLKVQMATATGATFEDITGSSLAGAAARQSLAVSVVRPGKRYVRASITATGGAIGPVWSVRSQVRAAPVTNTVTGSGGAKYEIHLQPATGTA